MCILSMYYEIKYLKVYLVIISIEMIFLYVKMKLPKKIILLSG